MTHKVFMGWDAREADAYRVAAHSLIRHCDNPVHVHRLSETQLRARKIYTRPFTDDPEGFRIDGIDGKPYSTEFAFTRFLVPHLTGYRGWALFCDADFLFRGDISDVFDRADDSKAILCVKHQHVPSETVKMDGVPQSAYPRKNWSSFVLWNCAHPKNLALTPHMVNTKPGLWLHTFAWLDDADIGHLYEGWNWLVGISPTSESVASYGAPERFITGIHFTLGGPWFADHRETDYSNLWRRELAKIEGESNHAILRAVNA